jgi:hypothetical protein
MCCTAPNAHASRMAVVFSDDDVCVEAKRHFQDGVAYVMSVNLSNQQVTELRALGYRVESWDDAQGPARVYYRINPR